MNSQSNLNSPNFPSGNLEKMKPFFELLLLLLRIAFLPQKKDESPEDVESRNRAYQSFCDLVNSRALETEKAVLAHLDNYANSIVQMTERAGLNSLKNCISCLNFFQQQINLLKSQISGLIGAEVSRHLTDSNPDCVRIRSMLPGQEKDVCIREFISRTIRAAIDKCSYTIDDFISKLQANLLEDIQDELEISKRNCEDLLSNLKDISENQFDLDKCESIREQSEIKLALCSLIEQQLGR